MQGYIGKIFGKTPSILAELPILRNYWPPETVLNKRLQAKWALPRGLQLSDRATIIRKIFTRSG